MIKQLNRFLFIVTFFFILFSSCKKEEILAIQTDHLTTINELKSLVSQIKIWHDSITNNITVGNSENNIKSLSLNSNDIIPPVIDWDKAYKNFDSTQKIGITIPLKYDPLTGNYLQLVACKFKSKISGFLVNSLPDSSYHILHKSAFDYSNFTGNIIVYDLNGKFLNKINFKQGDPIIINNFNSSKMASIKSNDDVDLPIVTVTGHRKKTVTYLYISFTNNPLQDEGIDEAGGGGGVPVGGNESPDEPAIVKNKIINPCLSSIVDKIINAKLGNDMTKKMFDIFGKSDKINLNFIQGITLSQPAEYTLDWKDFPVANYNITIDMTKLNDASDEYIASCVIHEIAHSLIRNEYSDVNSYNNLTQPGRHYQMLINYATLMKIFLKETFNLNDNDAYALIFTGMSDLNKDVPNPFHNKIIKDQWDTDFKNLVTSLSNLSLTYGDSNYYITVNEQFVNGSKGIVGCKF